MATSLLSLCYAAACVCKGAPPSAVWSPQPAGGSLLLLSPFPSDHRPPPTPQVMLIKQLRARLALRIPSVHRGLSRGLYSGALPSGARGRVRLKAKTMFTF